MWRAFLCLTLTLIFEASAHADTLPPGKKLIQRRTEIRDLDRTGDDVLLLHVCHPASGGDFGQDYCVMQSSGPFRLTGRPYFVPKRKIHLEPVKDNTGTADLPRAMRITELSKEGVETRRFFEKSPLVRAGRDIRASDSAIVPVTSDLMLITDVWRVVQATDGGPSNVFRETIVFQCRTGEKLERTPPEDPFAELDIPTCPRDQQAPKPTPSASSAPEPRPAPPPPEPQPANSTGFALAIAVGFVLIGAVAALSSRKR
jgi:hypothetical protein